jgi:hypothetical protein
MRLFQSVLGLYIVSLLLFSPSAARGHAFPVQAEPGVGAVVKQSPTHVRIRFDSPIEPATCVIHVQDREGKRVDRNDSRLDPIDPRLVEVSLPLLPPGKYKVIWHVITLDGHRAEGDYVFVIGDKE